MFRFASLVCMSWHVRNPTMNTQLECSECTSQELDIFATQQATSSSQPSRAPLHACHNVLAIQQRSLPSSQPKSQSKGAQLHHQKPGDAAGHECEYDAPTQEQDSQNDGPQLPQSLEVKQQFAHQQELPELAVASAGLTRLVNQQALPRRPADPVQVSDLQRPDAERPLAAFAQAAVHSPAQHPVQTSDQQHWNQQQQQQQLALACSDAPQFLNSAQLSSQPVIGQTPAGGGILQVLEQLHQKPPRLGLTVGLLIELCWTLQPSICATLH